MRWYTLYWFHHYRKLWTFDLVSIQSSSQGCAGLVVIVEYSLGAEGWGGPEIVRIWQRDI